MNPSAPPHDEPLLYGRQAAQKKIGIGCTKFYEIAKAGLLDVRKIGNRTMVTAASLHTFVDSLPKAAK